MKGNVKRVTTIEEIEKEDGKRAYFVRYKDAERGSRVRLYDSEKELLEKIAKFHGDYFGKGDKEAT